MKLAIICPDCATASTPEYSPVTVEMRDDGFYRITCPAGHTSLTALQEQKFEILFDIGAYALLDGYYPLAQKPVAFMWARGEPLGHSIKTERDALEFVLNRRSRKTDSHGGSAH